MVGRDVLPEWIRHSGGIRQGDTPSPAMFALLTALLCQKLQQRMPQVRLFLYADDNLMGIKGSPVQVQAAAAQLKDIMQEYEEYAEQKLNLAKCSAILQDDCGPLTTRRGTQK